MPDQFTGQKGIYRVDPAENRRGGRALIYKGVGPDGSEVALKVPFTGAEGELRRECNALKRLQGQQPPFVVPLLDDGVDNGRPFLVLPWYLDSLETWLGRSPPLGRRIEALRQATETVLRLHRSGTLTEQIVHRDIKPGNFLVRDDGSALEVVLSDLGGVKIADALSIAGNTGLLTPGFAPPEQALPLNTEPNPSWDTHALAVTVFYGLTGRIPDTKAGQAAYTDAGLELISLSRSRAGRPKVAALRNEPLELFLDLSTATLLDSDGQLLEDQFSAELRGSDARERAQRLTALLAPELERCLEPNPRLRESSPRRLLAALTRAVSLVDLQDNGTIDPFANESIAAGGDEGGPVDPPDARPPWRPLVTLAGASVFGAGLIWLVSNPGSGEPIPTEPASSELPMAVEIPDEADGPTTAAPPSTPGEEQALKALEPDEAALAPVPETPRAMTGITLRVLDLSREVDREYVQHVDGPGSAVSIENPAGAFTVDLKANPPGQWTLGVDGEFVTVQDGDSQVIKFHPRRFPNGTL